MKLAMSVFYVYVFLSSLYVPLTVEILFNCEGLDVDEDSSVTVRSCNADTLELHFQFHEYITSADVRFELECNDIQTDRKLLSGETVQSGVTTYRIDPPFNETSTSLTECVVVICYEDEWQWEVPFQLNSLMLQFQHKCLLPGGEEEPDIDVEVMSSAIIADEEYHYSTAVVTETISHQQVPSSDISSVITATPEFPVSLTMSLSTGLSRNPFPALTHSQHKTLVVASNLYPSSSQSSLLESSVYKTSAISSGSNSAALPIAATSFPPSSLPQDPPQLILILTISIVLSVTFVIAFATVVFCIFHIAIQYRNNMKQDIRDVLPITTEDIENYVKISSSPSIITIVSPLALDRKENNNSVFSFNIGMEQLAPIETYSSTISNGDSSNSTSSIPNSAHQHTQEIINGDGSNCSIDADTDMHSSTVGSICLGSLEVECEERRQVDCDDLDSEQYPYIHIVDKYEILSPAT